MEKCEYGEYGNGILYITEKLNKIKSYDISEFIESNKISHVIIKNTKEIVPGNILYLGNKVKILELPNVEKISDWNLINSAENLEALKIPKAKTLKNASLASLAKNNPQAIKDCINLSKDKKYVTVSLYEVEEKHEGNYFYSIPKSRVKIKLPLEKFNFGSPSFSKLWVRIFEKAFAVLFKVDDIRKTYDTKDEKFAFLNYGLISSGHPNVALTAITGKKYKNKPFKDRKEINLLSTEILRKMKTNDVFIEIKKPTSSINDQGNKESIPAGEYKISGMVEVENNKRKGKIKDTLYFLLVNPTNEKKCYTVGSNALGKISDNIKYKSKNSNDDSSLKIKKSDAFKKDALKESLYNKIKENLKNPDCQVIAGSNRKISTKCKLLHGNFIKPLHAYAVLEVSEKKGKKTITVFDPHNNNNKGQRTIPFNDFFENFSHVQYEKKKQ